MRRFCIVRAAAVALAVALGAHPGLAQQPETSDPGLEPPMPEMGPPPGIEAIEVTGERLNDANIQDEAQAITAFTGADLDRANIVNADSLQFSVPGLHVGQSAQAPIITLRGIGTENASLTGEPGVAFHMDGINLGRPAAARVAFFDLETLEVKRGPQGLLGGKNSTSGHINLISRKPTDDYEVTGDVRFGNYDQVRIRGAVNVPLGEFAATRFALYQEKRDGFLDNLYVSDSHDPFDADDFGLRSHLRLNPAESLEVLLSYNYFRQNGVGPQADIVPIPRRLVSRDSVPRGTPLPPGVGFGCIDDPTRTFSSMPATATCYTRKLADAGFVSGRVPSRTFTGTRRTGVPFETVPYTNTVLGSPIPGFDTTTGRFVPWLDTFFQAQNQYDPATEDDDPRSIFLDSSPSQRNRYWGWGTHIDWDAPTLPLLGETHLALLGGFQKTIGGITNDFDATDARVSYYEATDDADQYSAELQWSGLGLRERLEWQTSLFYLHEKAERTVYAPGIDDANQGSESIQTTNNKAYGAALHGTYEVVSGLNLSLGGRFIKDKKETWLERGVLDDNINAPAAFTGCNGYLGVQRPPRRPATPNEPCSGLYRGFMWGTGLEWRPFGDDHLLYANLNRGYKSGGFRASAVGEYLPEEIWAYSLGNKSEFFDQRLRVNVEGFFYSYDKLQLVIIDGFTLRTENTDARMWGWDLETVASPVEGLNLSAVVSYLRTETIDYFSLDPANVNQWQAARLGAREDGEAAAANAKLAGIPLDPLSQFENRRSCLTSNEDSTPVRCGDLGGNGNGLDDFSGNSLSRSPRWKLTLSGDYELPLGRFGSLTPRAQYTWQDETYFRAFNKEFELQKPYHLTDVSLTWRSPENIWSVEVFVQNIEDEAAKQNILIGPRFFGSPALAWYGPPRMYGVQVGFKY